MADDGKNTSGWLTASNATTALVVVDTVGLIALAWWSTGKIGELECEQTKLNKKIDKLEKRVDLLSKQVSKPDTKTSGILDAHGNSINDIKEDIEELQVQLESYIEGAERPFASRHDLHVKAQTKKRPPRKISQLIKKKIRASSSSASYTSDSVSVNEDLDDASESQNSEIDYDAIYKEMTASAKSEKEKSIHKKKHKK